MTREEIEKDRTYQTIDAGIEFCKKYHPKYEGDRMCEIVDAFEAGAEWEHKRLVDKACEWLYDNFYEHPHEKKFICSEKFTTIEDMIAWFQIIMEE